MSASFDNFQIRAQCLIKEGTFESVHNDDISFVKFSRIRPDERAIYNTPMQTVISGDIDVVESITSHFAVQGRKTKILVVGHAFHFHHMDGMLVDFRAVAKTVRLKPPQLSNIAILDGRRIKASQLEQAEYWVKQAREPTRFGGGIQASPVTVLAFSWS
jgi:acyl transferase domain-containing protein